MAARVNELCDEAVTLITAAMTPGDATVTRVYVPQVDPADLTGRVVLVWWQGTQDGGPVSRGEDATLYQIGIVTVEKYTGDESIPPNAWVDERVEWVQTVVDATLTNARQAVDGAWAEAADPVYAPPDQEQLIKGVFWAATIVTLRDER